MFDVLEAGTATLNTGGANYATIGVGVPGMTRDDTVILTAYITNNNSGPANMGPLLCPFLVSKGPDTFNILVYDIQAGASNSRVSVDWAVIKKRK